MITIVLWCVSLLCGGFVCGTLASGLGGDRARLLVDGEPPDDGWWAIRLGIVVVLLLVHVLSTVLYAGTTSVRMQSARLTTLYLGSLLIGLAVGLLLLGLYGGITPGQTNPAWADERPTPWDDSQWLVYLLPYGVQVLAAIAGIVLVIVGVGAVARDGGLLAELTRRRKHGTRLLGRVTSVEPMPGAHEATLVVASVAAPDGQRRIEASIQGRARQWLAGAKVQAWVSPQRPYDPAHAMLIVHRLMRSRPMLVTSLPPAQPPAPDVASQQALRR